MSVELILPPYYIPLSASGAAVASFPVAAAAWWPLLLLLPCPPIVGQLGTAPQMP
jgi:hypothetical protein